MNQVCTRRRALAALSGLAALAVAPRARAFGEEGAFHPRVLLTGNARWEGVRTSAPARWSAGDGRSTSTSLPVAMIAAGSRLTNNAVRADQIKARDGSSVRQFCASRVRIRSDSGGFHRSRFRTSRP